MLPCAPTCYELKLGDLDRPPGLSGPGGQNVMQSRVRFESYLFASIIRPIIFVVSDHALNRFESEDVGRYRWRTWHLWYWSSAGTKDKRYNLRRNYGAPSMPNRNLRSRRTIFFNVIRSDSLRNVKIVNYLECASQIVHCPHPARIPVL